MAVTRLDSFARVEKNFSPLDSRAFDAVDLKYDGFRVESLKDKSNHEINSFIDLLNQFASTISGITSTGLSSSNIDSAIQEFKGHVNSCSDAIDYYGKNFDRAVNSRLDQMNVAERRAYQTAGGARKFGESIGNAIGSFLDSGAQQVADSASKLQNWAKQRKSSK